MPLNYIRQSLLLWLLFLGLINPVFSNGIADYGKSSDSCISSFTSDELQEKQEELKGSKYFGSGSYQGEESKKGRPGLPDDLDAVKVIISEIEAGI